MSERNLQTYIGCMNEFKNEVEKNFTPPFENDPILYDAS